MRRDSGTALMLLLMMGCTDWGYDDDGLRHVETSLTTNNAGETIVNVAIASDEDAVLVTAEVPEGNVILYSITDPSGDVLLTAEAEWDSVRTKSGAVFPAGSVSANWPVITGDAGLSEGSWAFAFRATDEAYYYQPDVLIDFDILVKSDPDWQSGEVTVAVVYTDGLDKDAIVTEATEAALAVFTEMYEQVGIVVKITYSTYAGGQLAAPGFGDTYQYEQIASALPTRTIPIVIVAGVQGFETFGLYGMAGGIPGPLVANNHAGVVVDVLTNAGPDMLFSDGETRLYGETMAHEAGHYLGLFHPVETDYALYDAVTDTEECENRSDCEAVLGDNMMFPYPLCGGFVAECQVQNMLTSGQGGVMARYTGVQ